MIEACCTVVIGHISYCVLPISTHSTAPGQYALHAVQLLTLEVAPPVLVLHAGDMYLARFLLDEVPDGENHAGGQVAQGRARDSTQRQSPNNTSVVS